MIAEHENRILVAFLGWLGGILQMVVVAGLLKIAERYPDLRVPTVSVDWKRRPVFLLGMVGVAESAGLVSFRWLRWFASYRNWVGLVLSVFAVWFSWRILVLLWKVGRFLLFSSEPAGGVGAGLNGGTRMQQGKPIAYGGRGGYQGQQVYRRQG